MDLLAEDLLLLMLDEEKGRPTVTTGFTPALAGALLVELSAMGLVESDADAERLATGKGKIRAVGAPPADPVLALAWDAFDDRPRAATTVLQTLSSKVKAPLLERLVAKGRLREERSKVLGLFPVTRFPEADPRHEQQLRSGITAVLQGPAPGPQVDPRSAMLVSLLSAADALRPLFPDADRKQLAARAAEVSEGEWAGAAVRRAVESINAAVMTATIVPGIVAATS